MKVDYREEKLASVWNLEPELQGLEQHRPKQLRTKEQWGTSEQLVLSVVGFGVVSVSFLTGVSLWALERLTHRPGAP